MVETGADTSREGPETNKDMETISFEGSVHLIKSDDELKRFVPSLLKESLLGFDIESKPSFKKGEFHYPALLQLATEREVFLIRLLNLKKKEVLAPVFESENITKVGVGIRDDVKKLQSLVAFFPRSFVEISAMAKILGFKKTSLAFLTQEILGFKVSKKSRLTNWERIALTKSQISYAATDAFLSRQLYLSISERLENNSFDETTFCKSPLNLPLQVCGLS